MTDAQFATELRINAYVNQIAGYPLGHPARENFKPIVVTFRKPDGSFDRRRTLDLPAYTFTADQQAMMLDQQAMMLLDDRSANAEQPNPSVAAERSASS